MCFLLIFFPLLSKESESKPSTFFLIWVIASVTVIFKRLVNCGVFNVVLRLNIEYCRCDLSKSEYSRESCLLFISTLCFYLPRISLTQVILITILYSQVSHNCILSPMQTQSLHQLLQIM